MSLTAGLRGELQIFEILLENKHMNTNHTQQTSTPDADICGDLRTKCGQEAHHSIAFRSRDEAITALCVKVFGAEPVFPDTPPAPAAVEGFKGELDAKLAATTDEQLRAELEAAGCKLTEPAERPTPITDAADRVIPGETTYEHSVRRSVAMADLERQLAEAREQRDDLSRELELCTATLTKAASAFDAVCEQRDGLAEALRTVLKSAVPRQAEHPVMYDAWTIGNAALAAVKGGEP